MLTFTSDDATWIAKVVTGLLSFIGGALSAAFVWGAKMNSRDEANKKQDELIVDIKQDLEELKLAKEVEKREQAKFCKDRWDNLQSEQTKAIDAISKSICDSVRVMIASVKENSTKELTEIHVKVGILLDRTSPDEELRAMLKNILDQRQGEQDRRHE